MREERDAIKSELNQLKDELAARDGFIDNLKSQLEEKKTAIANLKTELKKLEDNLAEAAKNETFLSEELQRFKYGIVPSEESHGEQLQLFPTPEEPENDTTEVLQAEAQTTEEPPTVDPEPEFLSSAELAEWINRTRKPEQEAVKADSIRDWFKKKSTCSDKKRAEEQKKYGFKFSHHDKKGTCYFTLL